MGWTLFVFPPHAAGFKAAGEEWQRERRGRDERGEEASSPSKCFSLPLSMYTAYE